ncbi:MAG: hypothetical protein FD123_377 [Bacteroidetes bacterium]|nr:MAG: hypothetical protein FD123_377 [Bacteroidota bacterium]
MDSFSAWWEALTTLQKVFWCLAVPFSLLMVIQLIMTFVGADSDVDLETSDDGTSHYEDEAGSFQIFTIKNFIAFFTVMGWSGLGFLQAGFAPAAAIGISIVCGAVVMVAMAWLLWRMSKLVDSGTLKMKNAIGAVGEVYLTIPANKGGMGKVSVKVQGSLRELDAMTSDAEDLKTGSVIKIVDIVSDSILLVTKQ